MDQGYSGERCGPWASYLCYAMFCYQVYQMIAIVLFSCPIFMASTCLKKKCIYYSTGTVHIPFILKDLNSLLQNYYMWKHNFNPLLYFVIFTALKVFMISILCFWHWSWRWFECICGQVWSGGEVYRGECVKETEDPVLTVYQASVPQALTGSRYTCILCGIFKCDSAEIWNFIQCHWLPSQYTNLNKYR
jgi:hypothetical protein